MQEPDRNSPHPGRTLLACAAVFIASLALYWHTVGFARLDWDDQLHLTGNPFIQLDSPDRYLHFWKSPYGKMYVPLAYNTWAVLYRFAFDAHGEFRPSIFHGANILVHALNGVLILLLLLRLRFSIRAGFIGAILFCVHPLQVEAIAWISECRGLLATMFSLLAMQAHLSRWQTCSTGRRGLFDVATTVLATLALLSKPSAVVVPVLLIVIDLIMLKRHCRETLASLILPFLAAIAILIIQSNLQNVSSVETVAIWKRPLIAGDALGFYLWKLICPINLCADYARTPAWVEQSGWLWFGWAVPAVLLMLALLRGNRTTRASVLIFIFALAPVLGLVWFEFQLISTVADRYCYLAMLGPALAWAWLVDRHPSRVMRFVNSVGLIALACVSFFQSQHWRSDATLWQHAHAVNPRSSVALCNLGIQLASQGKAEDARGAFLNAVAVAPDRASPQIGLASLARNAGDLGEAESRYRAAMQVAPYDAGPPTDLASLLAGVGRLSEAENLARQATQIDPSYADAWNNLGAVLLQQNRLEDAKIALNHAIAIHPRHPNAYNALARVLAAANDPSAVEVMTRAAKFNAADASPCIWLGKRAMQSGDFSRAEAWLREAVRRSPDNIDALNDLGQSLAAQRKVVDAVRVFETALKIAPNHPILQENLEAARKLERIVNDQPQLKN